ncbi:MAG TPA: translocation/assembly module TamB domain-containing protein, partial [bacterium]|nr:translocation/assembly module TamB domain-containing protein [bacterium]
DEIRLSFNWQAILTFRPDFINLISRADLLRPRLVISRGADGTWNIEDLLSHQGPVTAQFHGSIGVSNGVVIYRDAFKVATLFTATFERISGEVGFPSGDEIALTLAGSGPEGEAVRLTGRYRPGGAGSEFDLAAANASAVHWGGYFVRISGLDWEGGRFGGQVHVSLVPSTSGLALDFRATLRLHDTDVQYRPQRLSLLHVSGPITVDSLHAETPGLAGRANGSPLAVDGSIVFGGGPWIQIGVRSPDLDLGTVQALFFPGARLTLTGRAGAEVQMVGPVRALDVDGEATEARGTLNGQAFDGLHTRMQYGAGTLTLADLTSSFAGGRVAGTFVLDTTGATPSYLFSGTTTNVDVSALTSVGLTGLNKLSGRVSGHVVGVGTGTRAQVMGDVTMARGSLQGLAFEGARAIFWHDGGGNVDFDYLSGQIGSATVYSSGQVGAGGALDLDVLAHDLSLAEFGSRLGLGGGHGPAIDGRADLVGRATGTAADPVFSGTVAASHGRIGPLAFANARGGITVSPTELTTSRLDLINGMASYRVSGGLTFHPTAAAALRLDADDVDAQILTSALSSAPEVTGTIGGAVRVDGPLSRPSIVGDVALDHGVVRGQRIDHAQAHLAPDSGRIHIASAEVRVNGSHLTATGTIDPAGPLDLHLSAEDLHLMDINAALGFPIPAEGAFALAGDVRGTMQNPRISGQISARELVVRDEKFAASGSFGYEAGVLRLSGLQLTQGASRYSLSGEIRPGPTPSVGLALDVENGRVGTVLSVGGIKLPAALDGAMDGRIELSGPLDDPSARLSLTLRDATFGAYAIGEGVADLTLTHQAIDIDRFEIHPARGQVAAKGRIDLRASSAVELSAQDINPDFLRPFFQIDRPLEGRLNFTLQFSGPTRDPKAGISLEAFDAGVSGVQADRIAALAFYSAGTLTIEQGVISKGPHKLITVGTVPIDPNTYAVDLRAPLQLQLHLQDADLTFLSLVTPKITDASGTVAGEINIGGTMGAPQMAGFLRSSGGRLHYETLRTPLENLNIDLAFSQRQIEVHDLSATLGAGRAAATGVVEITDLRPSNVRMNITADHATLDIPGLYNGQVDAALSLNGPAARPTLAGEATFSEGVVSPAAPGTGAGGTAPGPNIALDVNVHSGRNMSFSLGAIRAQVQGALHVGGTFAHPLLAGRVTSPGGEVAFLGSTFRLIDGEAVFSEALGVEPQISARAQQVYGDTIVFLDVSGPATSPNLTLTASPPRPQDEIVTLIARSAGFLGDPESVLGQGVGRYLLGSVRDFLHLNEITLTYSQQTPIVLRIGKYLIQNLYLTLSQVWPAPPGSIPTLSSTTLGTLGTSIRQLQSGQSYSVAGIEYFLSPNLSLTFNADTLGGDGIFVITRFPF